MPRRETAERGLRKSFSIAEPRKPIALGTPVWTETLDEKLFKACAAEFLGTLLFLFFSVSAAGERSPASSAVPRAKFYAYPTT